MTYNLAALPSDLRQQMELQKKAALWVRYVADGRWTRERVRLELSRIADESEREALRSWLNHYDNQARATAALAAQSAPKQGRRHGAR